MLQLSSTSEAIRRCGSEAPDKLMFKKYTYFTVLNKSTTVSYTHLTLPTNSRV